MGVVEGGEVSQRGADALVPVVRRVVVLEGHARSVSRSVRLAGRLLVVRGIDGARRVVRREDVVAPPRSPPRGRRPVFALGEATPVEGVDRGGDARVHRRGGVLSDAPEDVGGEQVPRFVVEFDAREREDLAKLGVVAVPVRPLVVVRFEAGRPRFGSPVRAGGGGGGGEGWGRSRRIAVARGSGGGGGARATAEGQARRAARGGHRARERARVPPRGTTRLRVKECREFRLAFSSVLHVSRVCPNLNLTRVHHQSKKVNRAERTANWRTSRPLVGANSTKVC